MKLANNGGRGTEFQPVHSCRADEASCAGIGLGLHLIELLAEGVPWASLNHPGSCQEIGSSPPKTAGPHC